MTLIHCIAYDMAESLGGINRFYSVLNTSNFTPRQKQYLEISKRQTKKLEELIQELIATYNFTEEEAKRI